jgi:hypothetical protein
MPHVDAMILQGLLGLEQFSWLMIKQVALSVFASADGEYEGSEDADDDGLQHLSLKELQQMKQQLQSPAGQQQQQRQLIPSMSGASVRQQQQEQQQQQQQPMRQTSGMQQQQRVQSPAGQLGPAAGSGAVSGAPPAAAKTGLRKWFG